MCGRFCNATTPDAVKAVFKVCFTPEASGLRGHNAAPQWNVAPGQDIETITASSRPDRSILLPMRWGMTSANKPRPLINARSETMFEKPAFREAAQTRRCIVVASGWYEWAEPKKPYYITPRDDVPMGMAGLYRQNGNVKQCAIVTTAADGGLAAIHHRAPLVLSGDAVASWLNPGTPRQDLDLIVAPTPAAAFSWHPVSAEVGSTRISHEGLIAPDPGHGARHEPQLNLF
jgi:putative SOS response-associated peptidase YedK